MLDYRTLSVEARLGLDRAMETEWKKYLEFHGVVPCRSEEVKVLLSQGHSCVPTKWVLTDKNEHLLGIEYEPKYKARLVACGNFEEIGDGEDIRADSPTIEPEGLSLLC